MILAKALKVRNKLVGEITTLKDRITRGNSTLEGNEFKTDNSSLYSEYEKKVVTLITLKAAIAKANVPINHLIFEMSEAKDRIEFLKRLDTESGKVAPDRFSSGTVILTKIVQFSANVVQEEMEKAQGIIDNNQDALDAYNAKTEIEFELPVKE